MAPLPRRRIIDERCSPGTFRGVARTASAEHMPTRHLGSPHRRAAEAEVDDAAIVEVNHCHMHVGTDRELEEQPRKHAAIRLLPNESRRSAAVRAGVARVERQLQRFVGGLHSGSTRPSASSVASSTSASSPAVSERIRSTSADFGIARI